MYNPYGQFSGYNPYHAMYQPTAQPQPQQNVLPPQQVLQANGKDSVDAIRLSPNSSVLVMDTTAPIVWLCASDSLGTVTKTAYDITIHTEKPPVDMDAVEQRLIRAENSIAQIMEVLNNVNVNAKPDAGNAESKQNVRAAKSNSSN